MIEEIRNLLASHYAWLFSGLGVTVLLAPFHLFRLHKIGARTSENTGQFARGLFSLNIAKNNPLGQIARGIFSSNIGFHVGGQRNLFGIINIAHTVGYPRRKMSQHDFADFLRMSRNVGVALLIFAVVLLAASFGLWHLSYVSRYNVLMVAPVTLLFVLAVGCSFHGLVLFYFGKEAKLEAENNKSDASDVE